MGEAGRGPQQRPPDPEPGPGGGLTRVEAGVQRDVVADQGAHAGEPRHEVADTLVRVQRKLSAGEGNPHTCGSLLGPLEGQGVGEPGILAVPD